MSKFGSCEDLAQKKKGKGGTYFTPDIYKEGIISKFVTTVDEKIGKKHSGSTT